MLPEAAAGTAGPPAGDGTGTPAAPLPGDPYATPGFISAFRIVAPLHEPVFGATASTMSGALSEMERLLGSVLSLESDSSPRPDARQAVAAYFEILDMANILDVDRETSNLAVRLFCRTASTVVLRNKQVESMAAASLCVALDLRHASHKAWQEALDSDDAACDAENSSTVFDAASLSPSPLPLSPSKFAEVASVPYGDVNRDLKLVEAALASKDASRRESPAAVAAHVVIAGAPVMTRACAASFAKVPGYAATLRLGDEGVALACAIVERSFLIDACPRRAPASVSAAGLYLACQIMGARLTQAQVCRVLQVTEVTLRKVYRELFQSAADVVPEAYSLELARLTGGGRHRLRRNSSTGSAGTAQPLRQDEANKDGADSPLSITPEKAEADLSTRERTRIADLQGDTVGIGETEEEEDDDDVAAGDSAGHVARDGHEKHLRPGADDSADSIRQQPVGTSHGDEPQPDAETVDPDEEEQQAQQLLAMMQKNPKAVAAFAKALALMPQFTSAPSPPTPPAPPPLPNSRGAKVAKNACSPSPNNSRGTLDASTVEQVRAMMESVKSGEGRGRPHIVAPPLPPALPPRLPATEDAVRPKLRQRRDANSAD
jgi:transcription initiation factor TFIIIB Brf1 subunit/transcription initiation factor TFIIB